MSFRWLINTQTWCLFIIIIIFCVLIFFDFYGKYLLNYLLSICSLPMSAHHFSHVTLFTLVSSEYHINVVIRLWGQRRRIQEWCMLWRSWTKSSSRRKIKQLMLSWNVLCSINWTILVLCGYILHFKIPFPCVGILGCINQ